MLPCRKHRQLFSLMALAVLRKSTTTTAKRQPLAFVSAFSSSFPIASVSSYCPSPLSSSSPARSMASESASSTENVVSLSFLETTPTSTSGEEKEGAAAASPPPTLFVHGLDSSSHTWKSLLDKMDSEGLGAVAVDQRGCGKSPLGDADRFSPDALVDDLHALVSSHPLFLRDSDDVDSSGNPGVRPFVLVGHSMGGRVAMSFAARHPEMVAALVIEDMDIRKRSLSTSHVQSQDRAATVAFDRNLKGLSTPEQIVEAFGDEGYPPSQVEKWLSEGRVEPVDGTGGGYYYSQVNPAFRLLCYEQFFESDHGEDTWKKLATMKPPFPIHLMIADPTMTVCDDASVSVMDDAMGATLSLPPPRWNILRYPGATHSIHNSRAEEFLADLRAIIVDAAQNQ